MNPAVPPETDAFFREGHPSNIPFPKTAEPALTDAVSRESHCAKIPSPMSFTFSGMTAETIPE